MAALPSKSPSHSSEDGLWDNSQNDFKPLFVPSYSNDFESDEGINEHNPSLGKDNLRRIVKKKEFYST